MAPPGCRIGWPTCSRRTKAADRVGVTVYLRGCGRSGVRAWNQAGRNAVLIGPQGIGKSSALRLALPPDHPGWFADGLNLAAFPKERAEALQGRVIVEVAEMAGSTRAELESLKSFLSRTDDGSVRLAYRRNPETLLRRCIIVGTTNDPNPLPNDPSGNRRFVPVVLSGGDVVNLIAYMGATGNNSGPRPFLSSWMRYIRDSRRT